MLRRIGEIAAAQGMPAYAVGGCVRDWLLHIPRAVDLDVTVEGDGIAVARAAARALDRPVSVHPQFRTATLEGAPGSSRRIWRIDLASCRRETYAAPAAYPRVEPGTLEEDLFRRDFTINAMAVGLGAGRFGTLIDPYEGLQDLRRRALRMLHPRSFVDDPSRMLRGIRFARRFPLRWEPRTAQAAQEAIAVGLLGALNAGRFGKELCRMSDEPDPGGCLRDLAALLEQGATRHDGRPAAA